MDTTKVFDNLDRKIERLISKLGTRQTIHKDRVADNKAIATAQTAPLSLDKIAGFPFRQKMMEGISTAAGSAEH